ncbi:MAG: benzoate-CoA ligase family protein [Egibacteraceae bacterium]
MLPSESLNIADVFLAARLREGRGDRVALRLADRDLTYAEVDRLANRFGNALRALGVRQEERVLLALPDGAEYAGALFGILKLGAVVVMVNPGLPVSSLATILGCARASAAVVSAGAVELLEAAAAEAGQGPRLLVAGDDALDVPDELEIVATHRYDPAIWLFSGGTTGRPKAVVQTHASFANTTERYAKQAVGYRETDVTLSVPKLYFGYATGSNLFFPFAVGASAALYPEHPTADVVFAQIRRHRPTILVNVPKMVADLVAHPEAAQQDLSCLRFATSAGEALPPPLYERWKATFGVELLDGLGTAEMWHIFVSNTLGAVRPGSLGRSVPGFDVRVRDDDGRDLPDGHVGRLWVRGGSRALGYWQDLPKTAEAFRGEWFVGGDLARRDPDGFLFYAGRADDALKVGGKWLLPAEVESCLLQHPAVTEAAVVGVGDPSGLVKPVAFVVAADPGAADPGVAGPGLEAALQRHCLERLEPYKHPRRVVLLAGLPRTHLGKVDRSALKRLAAAQG